MIHGGFWRARYGRKLMRDLCHDLAGRGWAAWNIEYRRLGHGSGGGWPTTLADVGAAIDHLDEIRTDAPLDLGRVVTIGRTRGQPIELADGGECWVTIHPSYLLRIDDHGRAEAERDAFIADLKQAAARLRT